MHLYIYVSLCCIYLSYKHAILVEKGWRINVKPGQPTISMSPVPSASNSQGNDPCCLVTLIAVINPVTHLQLVFLFMENKQRFSI